ncbi:CC/Se motif family (seleno)protein [Wenzhouxiangella sp. EGI_FJ10305]|uniref:CC/Se motif family (seleno)protein n=1 Tax=Wenzhouxiangella sp. EGI_FJ10305 TaxID=3243768 RepID=UPI0035D55281
MSAGIEITQDARRWLARRNKAVMVRISPRHGCCGGMAGVPVAEPGTPENASDYRHERIGDIDVYIDLDLDEAGTLTIRLEGLWGLRRLFVEGADLSGSGRPAGMA